MQESVPQWDPIPVEHHMTWEIRLFIFFVPFVLVFFLIRATQLTWFFLRARKQLRGLPTGQALAASAKEIPSDIRTASIRAASLKRGAVFTLSVIAPCQRRPSCQSVKRPVSGAVPLIRHFLSEPFGRIDLLRARRRHKRSLVLWLCLV